MLLKRTKKGVTLVELIVAIVVLAIAIAPLVVMVADIVRKHAQAETFYKAMVLGRDKMEEILAKEFDDISDETDEPIAGYTRTVSVHYVDPDNPPTSCLNGTQSYSLDCYVSSITDYKRVDVVVHHELIGDLYFSCIVSRSH